MTLSEGVQEPTEVSHPATDFGPIPIPQRLRYDPAAPLHFGLALNVAFGVASTFIVANLYYCQPLLIEMSESFNVSYSQVSTIPALTQAGYATGILFLSPLGDLVRRRQLILLLVLASTCITIPLAITNNLHVFEVFSFFIGVVSVTPQVLLPLVADLAPPERRAAALSVVASGLVLGVLLARVISGVIANFVTWRVVYYMAIGAQSFVLIGSYFLLPDYPAKNKHLTYWNILWSMGKYSVTEPILIQACLINLAASASFSNFWVTLTFLLGGPPYYYSTLVIGLFALVGMFGAVMGPFLGRAIDHLVPWYASVVGTFGLVVFQVVQVAAGGVNVAAAAISTFGIDVFRQMLLLSLATSIYGIAPEARARLNAVFILSLFIGQVMGTAVGTQVFINHGWRAGAALSVAWSGCQFFVLFLRGLHCDRKTWFGYQGGLTPHRKASPSAVVPDVEAATPKEDVSDGRPSRDESEKRESASEVPASTQMQEQSLIAENRSLS